MDTVILCAVAGVLSFVAGWATGSERAISGTHITRAYAVCEHNEGVKEITRYKAVCLNGATFHMQGKP